MYSASHASYPESEDHLIQTLTTADAATFNFCSPEMGSSLGSITMTLSGSWISGKFLLLAFPGCMIFTRIPSTPEQDFLKYRLQLAIEKWIITLTKRHVSDSRVNVHVGWVTAVDHQAIDEFHALGTLTSQLSRNNNFTALGSWFHDESEDTIASSTPTNKCFQVNMDKFFLIRLTFGQPNHQWVCSAEIRPGQWRTSHG